tara:strand:- start:1142 stop:1912 length:771 start_codon:yes stop_codon:yes gene_type:complete
MNDIITLRGLEMRYGRKRVLEGFEFQLQAGQVTVLLGQNGSGKSTLMRALLGVLRPHKGSVRVFGKDPVRHHKDVLRRVGYVPDVPDVYPWMNAKDLFKFLAPQYPTWNKTRCRELCAQLDVPMKTRFKAMSRGQGMKTMLVAALSSEPDLLLLDEPFAGLDALVREEVLQGVLGALKDGDREISVLCATHELDIAARIADRVAVLQDGRVHQHGTLAEVLGEEEPAQVPSGLQQVLATAAKAKAAAVVEPEELNV